MATPAFANVGTRLAGASSTTANVAVPSGVTPADGIVDLAFISVDLAGGSITVTPPSGFTEAADSPISSTVGGNTVAWYVFWKRATGTDTGTYDFTLSAARYRVAWVARYTGCIATGNPLEDTASGGISAASSDYPSLSVDTTGPDRLLVWAATNYLDSLSTPPTGFTEDAEDDGSVGGSDLNTCIASKSQAAAGSSGSLVGTTTNTGANAAWLGALLPVAAPSSNPGQFFAMF